MTLPARVLALAALVLATLFPLLLAAPAGAQGTYGQLPDPITGPDLARLSRHYLHPTRQEQETIEGLHDAYKERFRVLREGDIEKFLVKMRSMQDGGMPSKANLDEFLKGYDRVNRQIEELDASFFESVGTLLGEERQAGVLRARDARARARTTAGVLGGMSAMSPIVDVADIVLESGLKPASLEAIQPALIAYELKLTASMKDLSQVGLRTARDMFDEFEKAGFGELDQEEMMQNPEKMQEMMAAMQAAVAKVTQRFMAKTAELGEFNRKFATTVQASLEGIEKRRLRQRYLAKAYGEVVGTDPGGVERLFLWALRSGRVDAAAKEQIQAAYDRWQAADNAIVDDAVKWTDEFRATTDMMNFGERYQEQMQKLAQFSEKRDELAESALGGVRALIGEERTGKVLARLGDGPDDMFDTSFDPEADEGEGGGAGLGVRASGVPIAPPDSTDASARARAIDRSAIEALADCLGLDGAQRMVPGTIHDDYLKQWAEEIQPLIERRNELDQKRWAGTTSASTRIDAAQQAAYYDTLRTMHARAAQVDDSLFQNLAAALGPKAGPAVAVARVERSIAASHDQYATVTMNMGMSPQAHEVNFAMVIRDAKLPAADADAAFAAVAAHADSVVKSCRETMLARIEIAQEQDKAVAAMPSHDPVSDELSEHTLNAYTAMNNLHTRQQELQARRTAALDAGWAAALAALSAERKDQVLLAYQREQYPSIFNDPKSAHGYIAKAIALADLTDVQRAQLTDLRDRYEAAHLATCRTMLPDTKSAPTHMPNNENMQEMQRYWQEQMERANAREKLRFERDENSQRTISQLRRVLTDAQITRIAGLADYEKSIKQSQAGPFGSFE